MFYRHTRYFYGLNSLIMVEEAGFEPTTSALSAQRSNRLSYSSIGGREGTRTPNLLLAKQTLSH